MGRHRRKSRNFKKGAMVIAFFGVLFCLINFSASFNTAFETVVATARTTFAEATNSVENDSAAGAGNETVTNVEHGAGDEVGWKENLSDKGVVSDGFDKDAFFLPNGATDPAKPEESVISTETGESEQPEEIMDPEELFRMTFSPVPASPPVPVSYFDDALFIGDSRVVGLMLYSDLTEATFYAEKGVNVNTVLTNKLVLLTGGAKISIPEALQTETFGKIYIKMGLNELGWRIPEGFIDVYGQVIDRIKELQPDAVFYVQSILPVSMAKSVGDQIFNNERISLFNELIQKMAWEKGIHYLDVYNGMTDLDGCLPEDAGADGIHMNKKYCRIWLEYLLRHTVRDDENR